MRSISVGSYKNMNISRTKIRKELVELEQVASLFELIRYLSSFHTIFLYKNSPERFDTFPHSYIKTFTSQNV